MVSYNISREINTKKDLSTETIFQFIKTKLGEVAKVKKAEVLNNKMTIGGVAKSKVFSPMVVFTADVFTRFENSKVKIDIVGSVSPNWIFYLYLALGVILGTAFGLFFVLAILAVVLFFIQKNVPNTKFEEIIKYLEIEVCE